MSGIRRASLGARRPPVERSPSTLVPGRAAVVAALVAWSAACGPGASESDSVEPDQPAARACEKIDVSTALATFAGPVCPWVLRRTGAGAVELVESRVAAGGEDAGPEGPAAPAGPEGLEGPAASAGPAGTEGLTAHADPAADAADGDPADSADPGRPRRVAPIPEACETRPCTYRGAHTRVGPLVLVEVRAAESEVPAGVWLGMPHPSGLVFVDLWEGAGPPVRDGGVALGPAHALSPHDCGGVLALLAAPRTVAGRATRPAHTLMAREAALAASPSPEPREACRPLIPLP